MLSALCELRDLLHGRAKHNPSEKWSPTDLYSNFCYLTEGIEGL